MAEGWPGVSVIIPILNEERHLDAAVKQILDQDYQGPIEIVLALGPSKDRTDAVAAALAAADPRIRTVANPSGRTPSALNAAIAESTHDIIVRVDGHALIPVDYISTGVEVLLRTGADNVGGIMGAEGVTPFEQAVAAAMTSKFGVGGAAFHVGGHEGEALTVYLGCFRRSAIERVGGYDETMIRAQDWEMNHRIRQSGGRIWFTPKMRVTYRPRPTVRALASQYLQYGRWRREVVRRYPATLSARYLAPPVAVTGIIVGVILGIVGSILGFGWLAALGFAAPLGYLLLVIVASLVTTAPLKIRLRLPLVFLTMHMSWGWGFLRAGAVG